MTEELRETHAKRLIQDKLFQESWEVLREQLMSEWEHSQHLDIERRESLWLSVKLIDRIRAHFESIAETGKMSDYIKTHPDLDDVNSYLIDALTSATPEQAMKAVEAAEKRGMLDADLKADLAEQIEFSMSTLTPLIDDYSPVLKYLKQ